MSHLDARNQRWMQGVLEDLAPQLGFGLFPGFPERVIFRKPSCRGLCVLDVAADSLYKTPSHTGALAEVRALLGAAIGESVPEEAVLVVAGAPAERHRRQET